MSGRTGARRQAGPAPEAPRGKKATYRGIRWRRDPDGTIGWYNDGAGGWVRWRPDGDAPPMPPAWAEDASRVPTPPRVRRASWRSPYRLVPIGLVVAAVVYGVVQAASSGNDDAAHEAQALVGKCLPQDGSGYALAPVGCATPAAAGRVVRVAVASDHGGCPAGSRTIPLGRLGARVPYDACVARLPKR